MNGPVSSTLTTTAAFQTSTTKVPVLLQAARVDVFNPGDPSVSTSIRTVGANNRTLLRSFKNLLSLAPHSSETMLINTFGSNKKSRQSCDVVAAGLSWRHGGALKVYFLAVPLICEPLSNQS